MPEFLPKKPEFIYFGRMAPARKRSYFAFWLGLVAVLAYWYLVRPVGGIGYVEDFCSELSRRAMAENLLKFSAPTFVSDLFMAPFGTPIAFFSWSIERDWLGAYVWMWNREFPFLWVYFAFSLLGSYFVVGAILRRMGLNSVAAWGLAAGVVVLHIPRHFKIWYHIEYLSQHWVYWSLFLDAWIWHRFIREKRWSWNLEIWRGFCLLGVLGSPGYFWGPMVLEWIILRLCFVAVLLLMLHRDQRLTGAAGREITKPGRDFRPGKNDQNGRELRQELPPSAGDPEKFHERNSCLDDLLQEVGATDAKVRDRDPDKSDERNSSHEPRSAPFSSQEINTDERGNPK